MNNAKLCAAALAVFIGGGASGLAAQTLRLDHPSEYRVQKGDTLWSIASRFLEDPWRWPAIWRLNEDQVADPHLIYPGDLLRLTYVDGQPRLTVDPQVVKLSPRLRIAAHDQAVASIPLEAVREFFTKNRRLDLDTLKAAPHMVSGPPDRMIFGAGDILYVRGDLEAGPYSIFRAGDKFKDPETGKTLGVRAKLVGVAQFLSQKKGELARFEVLESYAEILRGDRFLPLQRAELDPRLFPAPPAQPVSGRIMAVEGGLSEAGMLGVVAINRGADAGLEIGSLLAAWEEGRRVRDRTGGGKVKLPDEQRGLLMIFRVYAQMSFGLVLEAHKGLRAGFVVNSEFDS
ncbi:MAG: LysM peptidoglycan-binding domain-containing protein [Cellvibrionales bacterium]|nr:LysM peptidoglycan-binding domain-containing protein [Cellvibrionales bacterium]